MLAGTPQRNRTVRTAGATGSGEERMCRPGKPPSTA